MDVLSSIEEEVNSLAENMTTEMILLLVEKWETDIQQKCLSDKTQLSDLLNYYIRLKITIHHVRQSWNRGWSELTDEQFKTRINHLGDLIKEARRNYYVTKQRIEGQHNNECTCRGCRSITSS